MKQKHFASPEVKTLEVRKTGKYAIPAYPDKQAVSSQPDLLKTLPERWKGNAFACVALAATTALLASACAADIAAQTGSAPVIADTASPGPSLSPTSSPLPTLSPAPTDKTLHIVPVFEHGIGHSTYGCVSVAPPVFLSEQDALEVINELAKSHGLRFDSGAAALTGIEIPDPELVYREGRDEGDMEYRTGDLALDGFDETRKVAFEFVSKEDMIDWSTTGPGGIIGEYNFLAASKALAGSMEKAGSDITMAVFYDPHYRYSKDIQKLSMQSLKAMVKEDLRRQVLDFIAWLKAEGII